MVRLRKSISMKQDYWDELDAFVEQERFRNRSHAMEEAFKSLKKNLPV